MGLSFMACDKDDEGLIIGDDEALIVTEQTGSVDAMLASIQAGIGANGLSVTATVDHSGAAASAGMSLRPTKLVLFNDATIASNLMTSDQRVGIELPFRILIWEDEAGLTQTGYYNGSTLNDRFGIKDRETYEADLNDLFAGLTNSGDPEEKEELFNAAAALITMDSDTSVDVTYQRIKDAIATRNFNIIAEVNHGQNAQNIGVDLRPTRLIIFGNPEGGTPLMQSNQRAGIDLPLKILVWEAEDGEVKISYFGAGTITDRYDIKDNDAVRDAINDALSAIAEEAMQG
ncbi:MAG: hypothetical protein DHS20C18_09780 [Saprospiraceae bacterium]|nr:MAG: hypothetical protein DHS20C18_09780 [Saprospiraceae bacterium]